MTTVGDWIDSKVQEYKDLYRALEENPVPGATPRGIIEGEIALRKFEWDQVSVEIWGWLEKQERV